MPMTCDNCIHGKVSADSEPCVSCGVMNGVGTNWEGMRGETVVTLNQMPSLLRQVGGNHYLKCKIQPMEYSMANQLDPCQHTIVKYVTRFRDKNGLQDLEKARDTLDMLIDFYKKELEDGKKAE